MIHWIGEFGAGLASYGLSALWLCATMWIAIKVHERWFPNRDLETKSGCVLAILIFAAAGALLAPLFAPAITVLKGYSCRSADSYEDCIDPPSE